MPIIFQMWRRKTVLANLEFLPHPASLWYWNLNRPDWWSMAPNKRVCLVSSELQISCSPNFAFQSLVLRGGAVQASANTPRLRLLYQNDSAQHQTLLLVRVTKQAQAWVPEWLCSEPNPTACYGNKASPLRKRHNQALSEQGKWERFCYIPISNQALSEQGKWEGFCYMPISLWRDQIKLEQNKKSYCSIISTMNTRQWNSNFIL